MRRFAALLPVKIFALCLPFLGIGSLRALDSVVTINEIMYHPSDETSEWLELHNQMAVDVDMSDWRLSAGIDYEIPGGTVIPAGGYLVVALDPGATPGSIGPFVGRLANSGETLRLRNNNDRIMDEVSYADDGRWPVAPDGPGVSLAKRQPGLTGGDPSNWSFRTIVGGTPGQRNFRDPRSPGVPASVDDLSLVAEGDRWRFNEAGTDLGAGWSAAAHQVGGDWQQGDGLLGFETGGAGTSLPTELVGFWSFDNGANPADSGTAPAVIKRGSGSAGQDGVFLNSAARTAGIVAGGAAQFNDAGADGVNVGANFSFTGGLTIEMVAVPQWSGAGYDELFRKEDGGSRLLFSFQNDANNGGANPSVAPGPVLSFGLNTGGYKELDMPLDGAAGRPTLAELTDGNPHHFVATYDAASGEKAIWIDGTQRFSVMQTPGTNIASGGGTAAVIGNASTGGGEPFNGVIDEMALYDVALSPTDIAAHSASALAGGSYFGALPAPIATSLSDPLGNVPYVTTTYFETEFSLTATELSNLQELRLEHIVDDGAVFYINGVEIDRFNLPAGVIAASTLAAADIDNASRVGPIIIPASVLNAGTNRLAVEVHQSGAASDDIVFGARLEAEIFTPAIPAGNDPLPPGDGLVFSEVSAAGDANFRVELTNRSSAAIELAGFEIANTSTTGGGSFVMAAQSLSPGEFVVFDAATLGFGASSQDRLFLYAPGRSDVLDALEVKDRPLARQAGAVRTDRFHTPDVATFGLANSFSFEDAVVINEICYHAPPQLASPAGVSQVDPLLSFGDTWRYDEEGDDLGSNWATAAHPLGGNWSQGAGALAFEANGIPIPQGTALTFPNLNNPRVVTYYFEREFQLTQAQFDNLASFDLAHLIDDGAVFYINGVEVARFKMDGAIGDPVAASSFANGGGEAEMVGAVTVSAASAVVGSNRISVEVHQASLSSSDVVFALELGANIGTAAVPFGENDEEWIELFNRSGDAVDIGGWGLDGAVDFIFAPGTMIGSGEHVLVARDPVSLAAKHPGVRILGGYAGKLADGGELIRLEDANRNPADEVHYYDGGRWSESPDGGGSSLELRDPAADNTVAEAWAASDEVPNSAWRTISYRGLASSPTNSNDPSGYHELVLGMLDSGECLIDDISVIEDPDGAARQLIQNGSFNSDALGAQPAAWRVLGNHGDHGRTVVTVDPDNGSNKVLHVVATGAHWHLHDHLETTLKDGGSYVNIRSSKEYQISFRARWLTGTPQLNSRLYFNRLARTHILPRPISIGTPGAANSALVANIGPTYQHFGHSPTVPTATEPVTVSVTADDPDGIASMTLYWSTNGGAFTSMPMVNSGGNLFEANLAGMPASTLVQFYIEGADGVGATSTFPARGASSRALFRVNTGVAPSADLHNLSILTTAADSAFLNSSINVMGTNTVGTTVVYNNEVYYDAGVRNKGSQRGRTDPNRRGFKLSFDPSRKFRGVHGSVGLDRSGGWRFGRTFGQDEIIIHHILGHASAIPSIVNDLVQLDAPNVARGPAQLMLARYTNDFLDGQFEDGGKGMLHNYELIYHPTTTTGGPEGRKRPNPDGVNGVPIRTQGGGDPEAYRYYFQPRSNRDRDDFSGMIGLTELFGLSGSAFAAAAPEVIDIDQWLRAYAVVSLCGAGDNYATGGLPHNTRFYHRPSDGRMLLFPWDMDFAFINSATAPLVSNSDLSKLIAVPANRRLFYQHVHDIVATSYNTAYMGPWVSHYDAKLPGQSLSSITGYIGSRAASALSQCTTAIPSVAFDITTNGGNSFSSSDSSAILEGKGWVDVREIRIAGSSVSLPVTWTGNDTWRVSIPLVGGANSIILQAIDLQGNLVANDTIDITNTGTTAAPVPGDLVVTELMYHPSPPTATELAAGFSDQDDFEFIELLNRSDHTLNLEGVRISDGVDLTIGAGVQLAPGERLVIVEDLAAFNARYPAAGINFGGEVLGGGQFSNNGEQVSVEAAGGAVLIDFSYSATAPWPLSADGDGYSLVVICPTRSGEVDLGDPRNWRSSSELGGNPGGDDSLSFADWAIQTGAVEDILLDEDHDGRGNYFEYLSGTLPLTPDAGGFAASIEEDPSVPGQIHFTLSFVNAIGADDAELGAEFAAELISWSAAGVTYGGTLNNGDGTRTLTYRSTAPISGVTRLFGRVNANPWD